MACTFIDSMKLFENTAVDMSINLGGYKVSVKLSIPHDENRNNHSIRSVLVMGAFYVTCKWLNILFYFLENDVITLGSSLSTHCHLLPLHGVLAASITRTEW